MGKMTNQQSDWPLPMGSPSELGLCPSRLGRINRLMREFVDQRWIAGGTTLVARHGQIAHQASHGLMDVERCVPMRDDAIFRIYSMTKPITVVAGLMLYEECAFFLDDPIKKFLPEFGSVMVKERQPDGTEKLVPPCRDVTIHDLMTHTGGLTYDYIREAENVDIPLAEFIPGYCRVPLACHPGERWIYSASNDVLGRLVEVVSGRPLDEFLTERIFKPLGMIDTAFYVPAENWDRLCAIYTQDDTGSLILKQPEDRDYRHRHNFLSGGSGLVSTTADYLRFCLMLLNHGVFNGTQILGRKTVELMRQDHLPPGHPALEPFRFGYGLGVSVLRSLAEKQGIGSVGEFGWGGAAGTNSWIDPQEDMVCLVMMQLLPKAARRLDHRMKQAMYQALI
jgi:CubicO group peptidase (beta-lactamase class C family)